LKSIPDLPIIVVAEDTKSLRVLPRSAAAPAAQAVAVKDDWVRWNDYGIGLFLQGDLRGAEAAFTKATEADPNNPDGFVNIGRALVQEGDTAGARKVLEKALSQSPQLARGHFFLARVLRQEGKYDEAVSHLQIVLTQYPKDRVVRNELGRVYFLQKRYADAIAELKKTLQIDPEDLQAHYNLMLCYTGLGDSTNAEAHKARYLRFKADESAQAITGPYRQLHAEDNNERQGIHEHVSVPLGASERPGTSATSKNSAGTNDKRPAVVRIDGKTVGAGGGGR
jgi:Flp pilus assembly protein TadD